MKKVFIILSVFVLFVLFLLSFLKYSAPVARRFEAIQEIVAPVPSKILETGLPNKHQISTTFIPQAPEKNWGQPWQDACEEAALLTVINYYNHQSPDTPALLKQYQSLFEYESTQGYGHDINISQISLISQNLYSLNPQIIENPTIDNIKNYLAQDIPVIITANGKTLFKENKRFKNGGPWYHSLVILGYDDNRQQFVVHDVGTQFGAYFKYSYSLLMSSIHDFPASGKKEDIDSGAKKILILNRQ